jgi:CPA1 family monovalent cation:H+ antiporter
VLAFEWIIGLLLGAMVLSALARHLKVPYPTFLALGGVALAFIPGVPRWTLEPDLALALLVAPVLLDAAFDTSVRDLRANWLSVTTLVLVAVALTTAVVAVLTHWLCHRCRGQRRLRWGPSLRRRMREPRPRSCAACACRTGF